MSTLCQSCNSSFIINIPDSKFKFYINNVNVFTDSENYIFILNLCGTCGKLQGNFPLNRDAFIGLDT
jgi:hypothetical protein